ncbi:MAG: hypothetical protein ACFCVE_10350 [Phycisphaerae bacterium]
MKRLLCIGLVVFSCLWAGQLWLLNHSLADGSLSDYWHWRKLYRPGIVLVQHAAGDRLPNGTFNPLSRRGATLAFVLSSGVYAGMGTLPVLLILRPAYRRRRSRRGARRSRTRRPRNTA